MEDLQIMDTWVWIIVAVVVALFMVGVLAILGSTLNERLRAAAQIDADADAGTEGTHRR